MILVIRNRSQFIRGLTARFGRWGVPYAMFEHDSQLDCRNLLPRVRGLVLSGGPGTPQGPLNLSADYVALANFRVPTLGLCLGHEIVASFYGGLVGPMPERQSGQERVEFLEDELFSGLGGSATMLKSHYWQVVRPPAGFRVIASSGPCRMEAIRHPTLPVYGLQFHPEKSGAAGSRIIRNFLAMCGRGG